MDKNWKRKRLHEYQGDFSSNYKRNRIGTIHLLRGDDSVDLAKARLAPTTASAYMTTTVPDDKTTSDLKAQEVTLEAVIATSRELLNTDDGISILSSSSERDSPKETTTGKKGEAEPTTTLKPAPASVPIKTEPIENDPAPLGVNMSLDLANCDDMKMYRSRPFTFQQNFIDNTLSMDI